ncbi:MAG: hypothetical protein ACREV4_13775 [Gammaproteobacteria bacterium]
MYAWPYLFMRTDLDNRVINRELWLPQIGFDTRGPRQLRVRAGLGCDNLPQFHRNIIRL